MKQVFKTHLLILLLVLASSILFVPSSAKAATASFYLSPSSRQVIIGDTVSASVMISADSAINAGEGSVSFSSDILEYQSFSTSGSIFSFWTSGPSGSATSVSFGGGLANPGYTGGGGTVLSITWRAKANGTATISISGSKILANDGAGTNIYSGSSGGTITVAAAPAEAPSQTTGVSSSTHPNQNSWYNQKKVSLSWSASGAQGYSFVLDQSGSTTPSAGSAGTTNKSYDIAADGIWYFHIRAQFDSGFGPVTHFRIQIDSAPPDPFAVTINQEGGTKNPTPIVTFEAKDSTSVVDHYDGVIDGGTPFLIKSGEKLPKQRPGDHKIVIRAIDKAGNVRESEGSYHIEGITPPEILDFTEIVSLLDGITFLGRAEDDDTIVIYLGDEEVARFKAGDFIVSVTNRSIFSFKIFAESDDKITWQYMVKKPLMAGTYYFRIGRIDKNGVESELSELVKVKVASSAVKIGKYTIPTTYFLIPLLALIVVLSAVIILLLKKLQKLARSGRSSIGPAFGRIKRLFSKTEKEIDREIDKIIPEYDLSRGTIKEVKKDLKEKIHQDILEEEKQIDSPHNNPPEK